MSLLRKSSRILCCMSEEERLSVCSHSLLCEAKSVKRLNKSYIFMLLFACFAGTCKFFVLYISKSLMYGISCSAKSSGAPCRNKRFLPLCTSDTEAGVLLAVTNAFLNEFQFWAVNFRLLAELIIPVIFLSSILCMRSNEFSENLDVLETAYSSGAEQVVVSRLRSEYENAAV